MQSLMEHFKKIPQQQFDLAVNSGIIIAIAISISYIFFGRLYSIYGMIGSILREPASEYSRNSLTILSGIIFISSLVKALFQPFDQQEYLQKISTFRLILSGALVGFGAQYAAGSTKYDGLLGTPRFNIRSLLSFFLFFGTAILATTYKVINFIPETPRILTLVDENLPKNISFNAYLLASLLVPFIGFLIAPKKSLKGLFECALFFLIGVMLGYGLMLIEVTNVKQTYSFLKYSPKWIPNLIIVYFIQLFVFSLIQLVMKYGFKKPLFSNQLIDQKGSITIRLVLGSILVGLGWSISGLYLESYLLNITSELSRIVLFWGLPCIFSIKAAQFLTIKEEKAPGEEKKQ